MEPLFDVLILAGGAARRLDGAHKPALTVGGRTLLDRVLDATGDAERTVVVGPRQPTRRPVRWTQESPPGGGPLAAVQAGLGHCPGEWLLLLSADLPFLNRETVRALAPGGAGTGDGTDGALLHDGRDQPLVGMYRTEALRHQLAVLAGEFGTLAGLPLRLLTDELRLRRVPPPAPEQTWDCDTWEDLGAARVRIREHERVLHEWMTAAKAELGVELDVDLDVLLDLARDAAHSVERPAAPLTTFLVGYAAAQRGGSPEDVAEVARRASELARRWADE
ncbi:NTP transferase domain-containing protein [Streptomyces sp. NPDC005438]|uniref:NTP transferase domain-containing protein n=1 Tax=Streptomyces sp. NPDC005438 TaxID=3156880 RepID=UPI0033A53F8E